MNSFGEYGTRQAEWALLGDDIQNQLIDYCHIIAIMMNEARTMLAATPAPAPAVVESAALPQVWYYLPNTNTRVTADYLGTVPFTDTARVRRHGTGKVFRVPSRVLREL